MKINIIFLIFIIFILFFIFFYNKIENFNNKKKKLIFIIHESLNSNFNRYILQLFKLKYKIKIYNDYKINNTDSFIIIYKNINDKFYKKYVNYKIKNNKNILLINSTINYNKFIKIIKNYIL